MAKIECGAAKKERTMQGNVPLLDVLLKILKEFPKRSKH